MNGPSPHLTWEELRCSDGTPYPLEWRETRGAALGLAFEAFRAECGGTPLKVLSGYRTPGQNDIVGGAADSRHTYGDAIDVSKPTPLSYGAFVAAAFRCVERGLVRGVGIYAHMSSIHLDCRPGPLTVWVK